MSDSMSVQQMMSAACDEELVEFGDTARGAGYRRGEENAATVYGVMLGLVRQPSDAATLLDFGCGTGGFYSFLRNKGRDELAYTGLDLSAIAIDQARAKFPGTEFLCLDILEEGADLPVYDYVIANGVFHWRGSLTHQEMASYWQRLIATLFRHCRVGLAFNAMSKVVDWERDDLFHLSFDSMADFVTRELSRHLVVRHDYSGYEYTTYIYRRPVDEAQGPQITTSNR